MIQLYKEQRELEPEIQEILSALKGLLRTHVLRPARSSVLNSLRPRDVQSSDVPKGLLELLLAPLMDILSKVTAGQGPLKAAALLFEIAAEDLKHKTAKGKRDDATWVQKLFERIMQSAHAFEYHDLYHVQQIPLVEFSVMMLERAVRLKVKLKAATLEKLLQPLFRDPRIFTEAEWSLVSLCIELEPDVFVGSPGGIHVNKERSLNIRNELLVSLLDQINQDGYKFMSMSAGPHSRPNVALPYKTILSKVVIPLAQAFVQARELPKFLDIWQEQLEKNFHRETNDMFSVWTDNELPQTVASLLESTLAISETEKRLHLVNTGLQSLLRRAEPYQPDKMDALLCIAECLLLGYNSDRILPRLERLVLEIYRLLLQLITDGTEKWKELHIRCWKIVTIINSKWSLPHESLKDEDGAVWAAVQNIKNACIIERRTQDFRKAFHAFRFMLSLAEVQMAKMNAREADNPDGHVGDPIGTAVNHIIDASYDLEEMERDDIWALKWDGDDFIDSRAKLCLACCAQLASVPHTLRQVCTSLISNTENDSLTCSSRNHEIRQFTVLDKIYTGALWKMRFMLKQHEETTPATEPFVESSARENFHESSPVTYLSLWAWVSRSAILNGEKVFSGKNIQSFRVECAD